ncbi:hypothetical protein [Kribbella alba]|uniref:hypothetical protein n=1 Tax=Kribbella alba TaxID=190197 RepID=UPI0031DE55E0
MRESVGGRCRYLVDKVFVLVSRLVGFLADGHVSANDLYAAARSTGESHAISCAGTTTPS